METDIKKSRQIAEIVQIAEGMAGGGGQVRKSGHGTATAKARRLLRGSDQPPHVVARNHPEIFQAAQEEMDAERDRGRSGSGTTRTGLDLDLSKFEKAAGDPPNRYARIAAKLGAELDPADPVEGAREAFRRAPRLAALVAAESRGEV